jgi:predicted alpha/beta hydrolase family esterase
MALRYCAMILLVCEPSSRKPLASSRVVVASDKDEVTQPSRSMDAGIRMNEEEYVLK